jgi:hypothetical protein
MLHPNFVLLLVGEADRSAGLAKPMQHTDLEDTGGD